MRINRYVSTATGLSRRQADKLIAEGNVLVNGVVAETGQLIEDNQQVHLDNKLLVLPKAFTTVMLNKPTGYVVSRDGQGSKTIYDLLPDKYHELKPIGRLDKESSGLLLVTNDGKLSQELSHPGSRKLKVYDVKLNKALTDKHQQLIDKQGIKLDDGLSRLGLQRLDKSGLIYRVTMSEGRNRQIRRTFASLGYKVTVLNRTNFGAYSLHGLASGRFLEI